MNPTHLLAIAIPTYNRGEILRENLRAMLPELLEHNVAVYLSDDSSDDETTKVAEEFSKDFPWLIYRKNSPRFGHDENFFATLAMPDTDYVWYLGDSMYFSPGILKTILEILRANQPDFCFVNSTANDINSRLVEDSQVRQFLLDHTWYLTLSGATIYGRVPRDLLVSDRRKAEWKNFPQLGYILENCAQGANKFYWLGEIGLKFNQKKTSYWVNSAFDVFVKDWCALIRSFSVLFSESEQNIIIRSHAQNTHLFGFLSLIYLRAVGALTVDKLKRCKSEFYVATPISPIWAAILARMPQNLASSFWSQAKKIKKALHFFIYSHN